MNNSLGVDEIHLYEPFGNQVADSPYDYAATVYGFTGELTETINPLVHLRARDYNPALGVFTALDPFEGTAGRPMSLNGYSWVEGNVPNMADPSGECIDNEVCSQLGRSVREFLAAGCINNNTEKCCGPDATEWFHAEISNHMFYAGSGEAFIPVTPLSNLDFTQAMNLWRISVYGLVVDYGAVDYPRIAGTSPADYSCNRYDYISICGECHHSTDMGNFILGAVIFAGGFSRDVADFAGGGFNTGGQGDTTSAADASGAFVGYDFAASGLFNPTFNRDSFCTTFRQLGTSWHDRTRNIPGCENGRACVECNGDPTLLPMHSIPNWNEYVSTVINGYNRYGWATGNSPQDELLQKAPGLLEWLFRRLTQ